MTKLLTRRDTLRLGAGFGALAGLSACAMPTPSEPDIVDTAVAAGSFTTLVAAVQAADLVDTLKSPGPFTVFAPTDDAFAALPAGTVESLLLPENKGQLVEILTYHVVSGRVPASRLAGKRGSIATVEGRAVHFDGRNGVRINSSNVVTADIAASNGIIHVIDAVLLPR
ncbi:MAG: fasciclin domain-containing protein [Pseudomonadota bacterium]